MTVAIFDFRFLQCSGQLISACISFLFWNQYLSILPNFPDLHIFNLLSRILPPPHLTLASILHLKRSMFIVSCVTALEYGQEESRLGLLVWEGLTLTFLWPCPSPQGEECTRSRECVHLEPAHLTSKPPTRYLETLISCLHSSKSTSRTLPWVSLPRVDYATVCIKNGHGVTVFRDGAWTWGLRCSHACAWGCGTELRVRGLIWKI